MPWRSPDHAVAPTGSRASHSSNAAPEGGTARPRSIPQVGRSHLNQHVIGQNIAKRRLALGVSNHFKRVVDTWFADDPIVSDPDMRAVRIEKSNILLV
jgi:ATP-dependent protease Clp ATPase subunit